MLTKRSYYMSSSVNIKKGFTLIELAIVILIIGILSGVASISYSGTVRSAKIVEAIHGIQLIAKAEKIYFTKHGKWCVVNSDDVVATTNYNSANFASDVYFSINDVNFDDYVYLDKVKDKLNDNGNNGNNGVGWGKGNNGNGKGNNGNGKGNNGNGKGNNGNGNGNNGNGNGNNGNGNGNNGNGNGNNGNGNGNNGNGNGNNGNGNGNNGNGNGNNGNGNGNSGNSGSSGSSSDVEEDENFKLFKEKLGIELRSSYWNFRVEGTEDSIMIIAIAKESSNGAMYPGDISYIVPRPDGQYPSYKHPGSYGYSCWEPWIKRSELPDELRTVSE